MERNGMEEGTGVGEGVVERLEERMCAVVH